MHVDPEIAGNNNHNDHYADDIEDIHGVLFPYKMIGRGAKACWHTQTTYQISDAIRPQIESETTHAGAAAPPRC
jgi:hypothetical protein